MKYPRERLRTEADKKQRQRFASCLANDGDWQGGLVMMFIILSLYDRQKLNFLNYLEFKEKGQTSACIM